MAGIQLDNGPSPVLALDKFYKWTTGVTGIRHQELGLESPVGNPCFPQDIGCSLGIMSIAWAHIRRYRQFVFTVNQKVKLPTIDNLFSPLAPCLDRPARFGIGLDLLAPIAPAFQSGRVQGYPLTESRERGIVMADQGSRDIFEQGKVFAFRQSCKEPGERGLVGDGINATDLCNEGIIPKSADQGISRGKPQGVLGKETIPERPYRVSLGATPGRAHEGLQKRCIIQAGKEGFKLSDRRGRNTLALVCYNKIAQVSILGWEVAALLAGGTAILSNPYSGAPGQIRTGVLRLSRPTLFLSELRGHCYRFITSPFLKLSLPNPFGRFLSSQQLLRVTYLLTLSGIYQTLRLDNQETSLNQGPIAGEPIFSSLFSPPFPI